MAAHAISLKASDSKTIGVRLPNAEVEAWRAFVARRSPAVAAALMRELIAQLIKADLSCPEALSAFVAKLVSGQQPETGKPRKAARVRQTQAVEKGSCRLELHLRPSEAEAVRVAADAANVSAQHWIVSGIRSMLTGDILGVGPEVSALNQAIYQLGKIGLNVNQMARKIHAEPELLGRISSQGMINLDSRISEHLAQVRQVLSIAMSRGRLLQSRVAA